MTTIEQAVDGVLKAPTGGTDTVPSGGLAPLTVRAKPAKEDPYAAAVDSVLGNQQTQLRVNLNDAVRVNPDQAAQAEKLQRKTGAPADVILRNLDDVRFTQAVDDYATKMGRTPALEARTRNDLNFARQSHDDLDALGKLETTLGAFPRIRAPVVKEEQGFREYNGPEANLVNTARGLAAALPQGARAVRESLRLQMGDLLDSLGLVTKDEITRANDIRRATQIALEPTYTTPNFESSTAQAIYGGASSTLQQLPGLAAAVALRNPTAALGSAGLMAQTQAYVKYRGRGGSAAESFVGATGEGVVEVATELLPMGFLVDKFGKTGAKQFLSGLLIREIPSEQLATVLQDAIDTAVANPNKTWDEYLAERPEAAYKTLVSTITQSALLGGANAAAGRIARAQGRFEQSQESAQQLQQVFTVAAQSKLRERNPETFAQYVQQAAEQTDGAPTAVYVDAQSLGQVLEQSGLPPEQLAELLPSVMPQMADALAANGTVEISLGELVSKVAGTPIEQQLMPFLRSTPDGLSALETQQAGEEAQNFLQSEVQRVVQDASDGAATLASREVVLRNLTNSLTQAGRFTPDVNKAYAALVADFYTATGARLGIAPEQIYERYKLNITAQLPTADSAPVLEQPPVINQITKRFEQKLDSNRAGAVEEYASRPDSAGGKILNTDIARELSQDYMEDRTRSADVHEPASKFIKELYAEKLKQEPAKGEEPLVMFTAGGTGAGKTTAVDTNPAVANVRDRAQIVYDTNMNKYDSSKKKIQQALAADKNVEIVLVTRDPVDALVNGALPRAMRQREEFGTGRTVPIEEHVKTHVGALEVVKKLQQEYANEPRVAFTVIDNSYGKGNAKIVSVDSLQSLAYAENVEQRVRNALEQEYGQGRISEDVYRGFAGQDFSVKMAARDARPDAGISRQDWAGASGQPEPADGGATGQRTAAGTLPTGVQQAGGVVFAQSTRGTFNPETLNINLLENADLSTFLHESGHFFLEVLADMATQPNAPVDVQQDMSEVLKWFGVADAATWQTMTLEQQRPHHEKFAQAFEEYLFDGKAPSHELQPMFQRFRSWMISVYRSVSQMLRGQQSQLTPEVRAVFDRLIATQEQITQTEQDLRLQPNDAATNEALDKMQARSMRDLKWTVNARSRELKRLAAEVEEKRKTAQAEARTAVQQEPVYAAMRWLRTGEMPDGTQTPKAKLSVAALKEMYGEGTDAVWRALPNGVTSTNEKTEMHPDIAAPLFGYANGDVLVRALANAEPFDSAVDGIADRILLERYGDLVTTEGMERAANEAVHNEARARFVATEYKALLDANSARQDTGQVSRAGRPITVNALMAAAKQFADNVVAQRKIRDLKPSVFTGAESRAARAFDKAMVKGETQAALIAKRDQMLNHAAARKALETQTEVDKKVEYLKKFDNDSTRKKLPPEYLDQIDKLLERFDLRKSTTLTEIDRRKSLLDWVKSQDEQGLTPVVSDELLSEAQTVSYKELTPEVFFGMVDTVRNIEHLGRLKNKLLTAKDKREFGAIVQSVEQSIRDNATKTRKERDNAATPTDRAVDLARDFFSAHRKVSSYARQLDGGKDGGAFWSAFVRGMNDAADAEAVYREQATQKLAALFQPFLKKNNLKKDKAYVQELGKTLTLETRLAVALNSGNETNLQRVLDGEKWTLRQQQAVLESLTPEQLNFVQSVWDFVDSYWPEIKAKEERISGIAPEKVQAQPLTVLLPAGNRVELRGGYYPIKYDADRSSRAEADSAAEIIKQMLQGQYTRATTRRGHTKARADSVQRPVRKDINVVFEHVSQVTHDLAWHEWLIDANRLLGANAIDSALRQTVGPEVLRQMKSAVQDIAAGDVPAQTAFEKSLAHLRTGVSIVGMGWNISTAMMQPLGFTQSAVRIGPKWMAKGLARFIGDAVRMESVIKNVYEKSDFMRLRGQTMNREINEIRNKVRVQEGGVVAQAKAVAEPTYFYMIQKMQVMVDTPTWLGQYEKSIANYETEDRAIAQADQAVRDAQGAGEISALARVQRGGPLLNLFTSFYSYFNTTYNLTAERYNLTKFSDPVQAGRFLVDMILLYSVPAALGTLLKVAISGGMDDEDELAKKLLADQASYLMGAMIGLRDLGSALQGFDYQGPAGLRFYAELSKLVKQISQAELDTALGRAANNVAGILFHYPAGQLARTVAGFNALIEGETTNPAVLLFGPEKK